MDSKRDLRGLLFGEGIALDFRDFVSVFFELLADPFASDEVSDAEGDEHAFARMLTGVEENLELAKETHPDVSEDSSEERFQRINTAYEALAHPERQEAQRSADQGWWGTRPRQFLNNSSTIHPKFLDNSLTIP